MGGYVAAMLAAFLMPIPYTPDYFPGAFDKLVHLGLFLGFAVLVAWRTRGLRKRRILVAFGSTAAFAGLVEVLQLLLPYRSGDLVDLVAGVAGGVVGAALGALTRE
jgi:VanZ family protein